MAQLPSEVTDAYVKYIMDVTEAHEAHPEWRRGQTFMNVLQRTHPAIFTKMVGTEYDTYNLDDRILKFLKKLIEEFQGLYSVSPSERSELEVWRMWYTYERSAASE